MCSQPSGDKYCNSASSTPCPWLFKGIRGSSQIDRIPKHDSRRLQIEAPDPVALLLESPVAYYTQAVEEHRPGQRVACLAFIQTGVHVAAQLYALQPVQNEQRALDAAKLAKSIRQAVLTRIATAAFNGVIFRPDSVMMASGRLLAAAMRIDGSQLLFQQQQTVRQVLVVVGDHSQRQFAGSFILANFSGSTRYSSKSLNWRETCTQTPPERNAIFNSDSAHSSC